MKTQDVVREVQPWLPLEAIPATAGAAGIETTTTTPSLPTAYRVAVRTVRRLRELPPQDLQVFAAVLDAVRAGLAAGLQRVTIAKDLKLPEDRVSRYAAITALVDRQPATRRQAVPQLGFSRLSALLPLVAEGQDALLAMLTSETLPVRELRRRVAELTDPPGSDRAAPGRRPHDRLAVGRAAVLELVEGAGDAEEAVAVGRTLPNGTYQVRLSAVLTFPSRPPAMESRL